MRLSNSLVFGLPALAAAQFQIPLGETFNAYVDKAKSYIPGVVSSPIQAGAARIAAANVVPITKENWQSVLTPSTKSPRKGPEEWMILVSGGNKTCYGMCDGIETAWNESASIFAADPTAPKLGYINCDTNAVLCAIWTANPPKIWHIQLPITKADQSKPATTIRIISLNTTTTTAQEIVAIHTGKTYEKTPVYEGYFHPFDGILAQYGLNVPVGWMLFAFAMVPSWAFMIGISLFSRTVM